MQNSILPPERRQTILEILEHEKRVTVTGLAHRLNVSIDTIRRDLIELEEAGRLVRVHGGALPASQTPSRFTERAKGDRALKQALAKVAVQQLKEEQIIFIDGGTTALEVAKSLPRSFRATIISPSPPVIIALSEYPNLKLILPGGELDPHSMTVVGSLTAEMVSNIYADQFVLGICSLHAEFGVTIGNLEESVIKQKMIENSKEVIAVTTADKLGTVSPYRVADISHITKIITEKTVAASEMNTYQTVGIEILYPA